MTIAKRLGLSAMALTGISLMSLLATLAAPASEPSAAPSSAAGAKPPLALPGLNAARLDERFKGFDSCFVLVDTSTGRSFRYHPERCAARFSPCSTYKIFNSLVGLETGVLKDENHSMKWNGKKYSIRAWNRDQTLQSAVTNSVVWYFQRVASSVGEKRMQEYLNRAHYGNKDISGGITRFWLGDSLSISADEQVKMLEGLVDDELPFSKRSMAIVRGMLRLEQTEKGALYGKTGSDMKDGKKILGWFVGYVVQPGRTYVFAANISAAGGAWGPAARELTKEILKGAGLL